MDLPGNCRSCPVWKKSLFVDLKPELIDWLTERRQPCSKKHKDTLFQQGEEVTGIYCHLDGLVKVVQTDSDDNVRFSRLVMPGDSSGHRSLFIESKYKGSARVISQEMHACFIKTEDVMHLFANNVSFAKNLVVKMSQELVRSEQNQFEAKENTVRNRLARLLCQLSEVHSDKLTDSKFRLKSPISKKELSDILSVASETMIRQMSEFKSEGLIDYEGKLIVITDIEKLQYEVKR